MMRRILWIACFVLAGGSPCVFSQDIGTEHFAWPPLKNGSIVRLTVKVSSVDGKVFPEENCKTFFISPQRARYYFKHAKVTSERTYFHDSDATGCHAKGDVAFSNGDKGVWVISRNGHGLLEITNRKNKYFYLRCYHLRCEEW